MLPGFFVKAPLPRIIFYCQWCFSITYWQGAQVRCGIHRDIPMIPLRGDLTWRLPLYALMGQLIERPQHLWECGAVGAGERAALEGRSHPLAIPAVSVGFDAGIRPCPLLHRGSPPCKWEATTSFCFVYISIRMGYWFFRRSWVVFTSSMQISGLKT